MKTYLLIGLVRDPKKDRLFPKPLCAVRADNLITAALRLGGHLHDPTAEDEPVLTALLWPDMPSAVFHGGEKLGAALAEALTAAGATPVTDEDVAAITHGTTDMLRMFEKVVIGQIPSLG